MSFSRRSLIQKFSAMAAAFAVAPAAVAANIIEPKYCSLQDALDDGLKIPELKDDADVYIATKFHRDTTLSFDEESESPKHLDHLRKLLIDRTVLERYFTGKKSEKGIQFQKYLSESDVNYWYLRKHMVEIKRNYIGQPGLASSSEYIRALDEESIEVDACFLMSTTNLYHETIKLFG